MENPRLRMDIQPMPFMAGERRMISFIDPLRFPETGVALDWRVVPILRMLDGTRDLRDIQAELTIQNGGAVVPLPEIEAFINTLDESLLLDSERFRHKRQEVMDEFARSPDRQHCLAGRSYDEDPGALRQKIGRAEQALPPIDGDIARSDIRGVLAPHIDINTAHDAYVDAYRHLAGREYDLAVVLGINHSGSGGLWSITDKSYTTPLGTMGTDRDFVSALKARLPEGSLTPGDFDHRHEHSIEFQAVFLRHYLPDRAKIVPILCGSIHEFILSGRSPFEDGRFLAMKQALHELVRESGYRVLLVSGVDFSHVGPKFGHSHPAQMLLPQARAYDERIIQALLEGDPARAFAHAAATRDYCNVCGLPSMLLLSWLLGPVPARLLAHRTYDEQATQSAVTYASMVFYG